MKLIDMIAEEDIVVELKSKTKEGVITEMVEHLVATKKIAPEYRDAAIEEILAREAMGSTGIGNGLAIPHNKKSKVTERIVGVFARAPEGIDYGAIDGEKTYIFFLFFSPESLSSGEEKPPHLQVLKKLALLGRDSNFCRFLRESKTQREIYELIEEIDEKIAAQV